MVKTIFSLLLLYFLTAAPQFAQAPVMDATEQRVTSLTYNEDFDEAARICNEQIKANPQSPKYYYYLINIKVIEYYQKVRELKPENRSDGRKKLNKEILDYCESVIGKFDLAKLDLTNKFYVGMIHGYLARVYGVDGSWWSALQSGKKTRYIMEEILKYNPKFYDAYLALGMLNYYADRMSGFTSFIAGVLGFSGDREKGLNQLQTAYKNGQITFGQTALTLIEVYSSLEGNDYESLQYYESFLRLYPKNKRTLNSYINTLSNIRDYKKIGSLISADKNNMIDDFAKARYYEAIGERESAVKFAEEALKDESKIYRGGANSARYLIAFNSWLMGDQARLKKYEPLLTPESKERLNTLRNSDRSIRWLNEFSVKTALDKPVNEIESFINSKPDFGKDKTSEEQFRILAGAFYLRRNMADRSEAYYYPLLDSSNDRDKQTSARFLIEIYMRKYGDKNRVKKLLDVIDDIDSDQLTFRSKDLEKKYDL